MPAFVRSLPCVAFPTDVSPIYLSSSGPECVDSAHPAPRLLPPIQLQPGLLRTSSVQKPSNNHHASHRAPTTHQPRRKRHCQQLDCHFQTVGASDFFDQLPWISALENVDPSHIRDLADLSQLDVSASRSSSGAGGPVRRRRTSSRSSPLAASVPNGASKHAPLSASSIFSATSPSRNRPSPSPTTPLPRFALSRVRFNNLLPVLSPADSNIGGSPRCSMETD